MNTIDKLYWPITVILVALIIAFAIYLVAKKFIELYTTKIIDIKNKELENEKLKLYSNIDPKLVKEELLQLIREYTARYMTKNIMVNHIDYIKSDQIDDMVKSIVKDTILEMSDMYLCYCKLLYNVTNEDELLKIIYYLTVDIVLNAVTNFNQVTEES